MFGCDRGTNIASTGRNQSTVADAANAGDLSSVALVGAML
jgi:hypothetical protein